MNSSPISSPRPRWLFPAVLALLLGGATWLVAESKSDAHEARSVDVKVDAAPLPRGEGTAFSYSAIVKRVIPSVVKVVTRERAKEFEVDGGSPFDDPALRQFFGPFFGMPNTGRRIVRQPPQIGLGSGVIVSSDGYILTNNHVVDGADKVQVTLADKRVLTAKVVGTDKKSDVAVIKVDEKDLPALTFADSSGVQVGDRVLAVGNPFGLSETVTTGIVSGLGRGMPGDGGQTFSYQDYIQTDAAINPGNSGGALVDMQGRLIGINTAIFSRDGGFQGIGFAIPANLARSIMDSLVRTGHVVRGYLGVTIQDLTPDVAEQFHLKSDRGAIVTDVTPDSPAAKAGLKGDDVILDFNGKPVTDSRSLSFAVAATEPGREATVRVLRDGKEETLTVKVGEQPGDEQLASASKGGDNSVLNGVEVTDLDAGARNEFDVPARVHGALVTDVDPSSASAEAGLTAGDVIMEINRQPVRSADDAVQLTAHAKSRKTLLKLWSRGGIHFLVVDETDDKSS